MGELICCIKLFLTVKKFLVNFYTFPEIDLKIYFVICISQFLLSSTTGRDRRDLSKQQGKSKRPLQLGLWTTPRIKYKLFTMVYNTILDMTLLHLSNLSFYHCLLLTCWKYLWIKILVMAKLGNLLRSQEASEMYQLGFIFI